MLLLLFAGTLLVAVLLSHLAHRTVLSTALLFLAVGMLAGHGGLGLVDVRHGDPLVSLLTELALFAVLFSDGMRVGLADLRAAWRLPGRALAVGLPLTLAVTALLAHLLVGLGWTEALLVGAILAPTDPVFAAALVGNERVPGRLRRLLNVESGINDGLALPFVLVLLSLAEQEEPHLGVIAAELGTGLAIGVLVPLVVLWLERSRFFATSPEYEPLTAAAIGVLVLALGKVTHGNLFLAAFAAGVVVATYGPRQRERFEEFGELVSELLKLGALLVFGALVTPALLGSLGWTGWVFAVLVLLAARPLALGVAFLGARLGVRGQLAAAWFGPKGFASVFYGLLVLHSGLAERETVFALVAGTVTLSILLHSSTDVLVARGFDEEDEAPVWHEDDAEEAAGDGRAPGTGQH